jgi:4-diphosphocytidyl-2C-methyl-D-erythritol kinase
MLSLALLLHNTTQTVGFGDTLFFAKLGPDAERDEFTCSAHFLPTDDSNLVLKALKLFRAKTGTNQFLKLSLENLERAHPAGFVVQKFDCNHFRG